MANQDISLSSFDPDVANIQRSRRLADLLQQQLDSPIPINSYNGIQAPISPFSALAKAVRGYSARKYQDKADADLAAYRDKDTASVQALARQLTENRAPIAPVTSQLDPTMPTLPGQAPQPAQAPVSITSPGQAGGAMSTPEQLAALWNAQGGPRTQAMQQAMIPQIMNRQNLDYQHQLGREDETWKNAQPMPVAMGQQIKAQGEQAQANAQFTNQLPETAHERAATNLGYAQLNKPVAMPFMGSMYDPRTRSVFTPGGAAGNAPDAAPDDNSGSLNGVTGLSQLAIDRLTGAPNQPRTAAVVMRVNDEIKNYSIKNNLDMSTLRARAEGINKVITQNTMRNNQAKVLEDELHGSVETLAPILDQMHAGQINKANVFGIWSGRQINDPAAIQAADQLGRMRDELASYNAVAGGHLMENGTPAPTPADYEHAIKTISDGINSGGARAIAQSVAQSAAKNRVVMKDATEEAQSQMWDAFGKGHLYKRNHAAKIAPAAATPNKPQTATEADILHTMQVRKMTRQQVLDGLKQRGIGIAP